MKPLTNRNAHHQPAGFHSRSRQITARSLERLRALDQSQQGNQDDRADQRYNDRADQWSMNLRFGWLQAANTGLFVVYTDTRGLYDLFPLPERTDRSLVVKFSRMFDLLR